MADADRTAPATTGFLGRGDVPADRWTFLSPHLDDAALSCGNLLTHLARTGRPRVVTLFTAATAPPTASARAFLRQCGWPSGDALFAERRAEDARVLGTAGARWEHVGLADALFRRRPGQTRPRWLHRLLPELAHVYPTYRWHVGTGRVAAADRETVAAVDAVVAGLLEDTAGPPGGAPAGRGHVLVAPLGIGGHVDHVLVRDAAARSGADVVYYADVPYHLVGGPDPDFLARHDLVPLSGPRTAEGKRSLIEGYRTQAAALFPEGVPDLADEFHVPRHWLEEST